MATLETKTVSIVTLQTICELKQLCCYAVTCRFMAELGKVVPILPIVTKSDSMTIREAATYRREVYRKLQNPRLPEPQGDPSCHAIATQQL